MNERAELLSIVEATLRGDEEWHRLVLEHSPDAIFVHIDEKIVFVNLAAQRMLRARNRSEVVGLSIWKILHPDHHAVSRERLALVARGEALPLLENRYVRLDGTEVEVEIVLTAFPVDGRVGIQASARDITQRKQALLGTVRMTMAYAALSATNEALFRIVDENALLRRVCEIAVELAGLKLAAIRLVEPGTDWLRPVAFGGEPVAFLADTSVCIDRGVPEGRVPAAIAFREGRTLVRNELVDAPDLSHWRDAAIRAGIASSACIPLRRAGLVIGLFSLYSGDKGWFDEALVALFEQMVENLSFGLENFDREARRKAAEEQLRESEERFRSLTELSSDWYWEQDEHLRFTFVDDKRLRKIMSVDDIRGKTHWEVAHFGITDADWAGHIAMLERREEFRDFVFNRPGHDGETCCVSLSGAPMFDTTGKFKGYRGIGKDITDKRRAEQMLALEHAVARALADAENIGDGLSGVLKAVSESEGWDFGRYWASDPEGQMHAGHSWQVPDAAIRQYLEDSRMRVLPAGAGMIGRVCETGEAAWVTDADQDARVLQPDFKGLAGLHGTCLFPVFAMAGVVGVLVFSSRNVRAPDARLLAAARSIGGQVGQFVLRKQSEEELKRFRAAMDLSADSIYLVDFETLTVLDCNDGACRELGYARHDLVGMSMAEIVDKNSAAGVRETFDSLARSGSLMSSGERLFRRKDGSLFPVELYRRALPLADGSIVVIVARNISERKRSEQQLRDSVERLECVIQATNDVIWDWDLASDILWFNAGLKEVFGHNVDMVWARFDAWSSHVHPDDRDKVVESLLAAIHSPTGGTWSYEYRFRRMDGSYAHVFDRGIVKFDSEGLPRRMIGAMADISVGKAIIELEDLARRLQVSIAALENANSELDAFSYTVSHDLKAPIRAIEGFAGLLQGELPPMGGGKSQAFLERIRSNARRMSDLLDDLLTLSKFSRQALSKGRVDTGREVALVIDELGKESDRVKFEVGDLPMVLADRILLHQVWTNLLSNAVKYSGKAERPLVRIGYEQGAYFVADNGAGFDMAYADKLFKVFSRLHSEREFEGTGAGLAIVKRIVERHGGRVWAEGKEGVGATFWFTLPGEEGCLPMHAGGGPGRTR